MAPVPISGQYPQGRAQRVWPLARNHMLDFSMRARPQRKGSGKQCASARRDRQPPAALVRLVDRNFHQSSAFKGLEGRSQGGAVHCKQFRYAADGWWFRPVQRHQKGKLSVRQIKWTKDVVKATGEGACRALHMQAQAGVTNLMGRGKRQFVAG